VVQWNSGAVVQIRWIMGLAISPSLQSLAFQKGTETRPVVYALSLRTGAGEDPPEHRLLGHWQYLVDHVEARLDNLRVDVRAKDQGDGSSTLVVGKQNVGAKDE